LGVIRGLRPLIVCSDPEFLTPYSLLYKMAKKTPSPYSLTPREREKYIEVFPFYYLDL